MWIFWTSEEPLFFVLFNLYLANKANKGSAIQIQPVINKELWKSFDGFIERNDAGVVHFVGRAYKKEDSSRSANFEIFTTLPEGFRPSANFVTSYIGIFKDEPTRITHLTINQFGNVAVWWPDSDEYLFDYCFLAG